MSCINSKRKLCGDRNCTYCFEKSLASTPFGDYLAYTDPLLVLKGSSATLLFTCDGDYENDYHEFEATPKSILRKENPIRCPVCKEIEENKDITMEDIDRELELEKNTQWDNIVLKFALGLSLTKPNKTFKHCEITKKGDEMAIYTNSNGKTPGQTVSAIIQKFRAAGMFHTPKDSNGKYYRTGEHAGAYTCLLDFRKVRDLIRNSKKPSLMERLAIQAFEILNWSYMSQVRDQRIRYQRVCPIDNVFEVAGKQCTLELNGAQHTRVVKRSSRTTELEDRVSLMKTKLRDRMKKKLREEYYDISLDIDVSELPNHRKHSDKALLEILKVMRSKIIEALAGHDVDITDVSKQFDEAEEKVRLNSTCILTRTL